MCEQTEDHQGIIYTRLKPHTHNEHITAPQQVLSFREECTRISHTSKVN